MVCPLNHAAAVFIEHSKINCACLTPKLEVGGVFNLLVIIDQWHGQVLRSSCFINTVFKKKNRFLACVVQFVVLRSTSFISVDERHVGFSAVLPTQCVCEYFN